MSVANRQKKKSLDYSLTNPLVDSHCHLDSFPDLKQIVKNAKKNNVGLMVSCATDSQSIQSHLKFAGAFGEIKICLGIHPVDLLRMGEKEIEKNLKTISLNAKKCVGIGEIGLDNKYAQTTAQRVLQEKIFRKQVGIAKDCGLPVVVHARFAEERALEILKEEGAKMVLMHWFTNSVQSVQAALQLGYFMSCGPIILSSAPALEIAKEMPQELLVFETDSPVAFLGKQSEPSWIPLVLDRFSKSTGIKGTVLAKKTTQNALSLFGISY